MGDVHIMQQLTLYNGNKNNYISVSMDFIDNYVCDAPGEFVKVYLYLLRCMETNSINLSVSDIADRFNYTEKDVLRALSYWEKKSLLTLDYDSAHNLCGIHFQDTSHRKSAPFSPIREFPSADVSSAGRTVGNTFPAKSSIGEDSFNGASFTDMPVTEKNLSDVKEEERPKVSRQRMMELADDPEVKQLLFIASQYLGKTLNPSETEILLHIFDDLDFSTDLIEYLIESSVEKNHKSMTYMEKTATQWHKDGITTVSQAQYASESVSKNCLSVMKALGITGRVLAQSETEYVRKWMQTYHFPIELVLDACTRTIQATGTPSFRYADTILTNWHKQQVHTQEDIRALDLAYQAKTKSSEKPAPKAKKAITKGNNFPQRAYDYDTLEQQLLNVN